MSTLFLSCSLIPSESAKTRSLTAFILNYTVSSCFIRWSINLFYFWSMKISFCSWTSNFFRYCSWIYWGVAFIVLILRKPFTWLFFSISVFRVDYFFSNYPSFGKESSLKSLDMVVGLFIFTLLFYCNPFASSSSKFATFVSGTFIWKSYLTSGLESTFVCFSVSEFVI